MHLSLPFPDYFPPHAINIICLIKEFEASYLSSSLIINTDMEMHFLFFNNTLPGYSFTKMDAFTVFSSFPLHIQEPEVAITRRNN
jgi:hypothetical protein